MSVKDQFNDKDRWKKFLENVRHDLRQQVLNQLHFQIHDNRPEHQMPADKPSVDIRSLLEMPPAAMATELTFLRNPNTAEIIGYTECVSKEHLCSSEPNTRNLSMNRRPVPANDAKSKLLGTSNNTPFLPGGMEQDVNELLASLSEEQAAKAAANEHETSVFVPVDQLADHELLCVPPGWSEAVTFHNQNQSDSSSAVKSEKNSTNSLTGKTEKSIFPEVNENETSEMDEFLELMDLMNVTEPKSSWSTKNEIKTDTDNKEEKPASSSILPSIPTIEDSKQKTDVNGGGDDGDGDSELEKLVRERMERQALVVTLDDSTTVNVTPEQMAKAKSDECVLHATALPTGLIPPEYASLKQRAVKKYPFELDSWQQQAVVCLDRGHSVFVSAHTSAGKTVVAEYAIALCQSHNTRAIYTSPIKALSNQKFHDFRQQFGDVGLITGDIQLHAQAFCLVMTTEILRSMLYNGSETVRELEWVIFDEVHYINDTERGVVWEEVLIMLPSHVKLIMLSATAPNSVQFADWVGRIKQRQIYVIGTTKRPVPLEHFLYTGQDGKTKNERFLIVDNHNKFLTAGYAKATTTLAERGSKPNQQAGQAGSRGGTPQRGRGRGGGGGTKFVAGHNEKTDKSRYIVLVSHLTTASLLPVVVFTFSRKRCDQNASMLTTVDLTTQMEKRDIHHFFSKCINRLKGTDRQLPQVTVMQELCKRGLAVHHSGILPILKEVVEMLFQKGYVKVLFATETFAMGVNMPARTVVFDSMRKHDGTQLRDLTPGEYTQMAGRAGRRGLDSTGTVIIMCKGQIPMSHDLNRMLLGTPTKLVSKFRVTYSLLLNVLRVEQLRVEDVLRRSYAESATLRLTQRRKQRMRDIQALPAIEMVQWPECAVCNEKDLTEYVQYAAGLVSLNAGYWLSVQHQQSVYKMLSAGRVLLFSLPPFAHALPVVLVKMQASPTAGVSVMDIVLVLPETAARSLDSHINDQSLHSTKTLTHDQLEKMLDYDNMTELLLMQTDMNSSGFMWPEPENSSDTLVVRLLRQQVCTSVVGITTKTLKCNMNAVREYCDGLAMPHRKCSEESGNAAQQLILDLSAIVRTWKADTNNTTNGGGVPCIQPQTHFATADIDLLQLAQHRLSLQTALAAHPCKHCLHLREHLSQAREILRLKEEKTRLQHSLSPNSLLLKPEFDCKLKLLRSLQYVDNDHLVQLKGKVACELHQQELLLTELMLENAFSGLTCPEVAAMLSCVTCQHKNEAKLNDRMKQIYERISEVAHKIQRKQMDCDVRDREDDVTLQLHSGLMHVVYEWANQVPFSQLMCLTDCQEGVIVRCIQRLDETLRDVRNAARMVGDTTLHTIMQDTSTAVKRDIVFAASLYTVD